MLLRVVSRHLRLLALVVKSQQQWQHYLVAGSFCPNLTSYVAAMVRLMVIPNKNVPIFYINVVVVTNVFGILLKIYKSFD